MDTKSPFASKTLIGAVLIGTAYLARTLGYEIDIAGLEGPVSEFVQNVASLVGVTLTIYGRLAATHKIALSPGPAATPPGPPATAGFMRVTVMSALFCFLVWSMLAFAGCAAKTITTPPSGPGGAGGGQVSASSDSPLVLAGKSLLAVKSTIVTAAQATDALCKAGTIGPDKCAQAKAAYDLAKPAYDSAVDAYLLMSQGYGTPEAFGTALARVQGLAANLLALSGGAR